jgi:hypothetical protein
MLTSKNYNVIAALIVKAREFHPEPQAIDALEALTNMLSGAFSVDNPNFNIERFRKAAGIEQPLH